MVFSSIFFLLGYLPIVLMFYCVLPAKMKNIFLLLASLVFYAWGEGLYVLLMLFVIGTNYLCAQAFEYTGSKRKTILVVGILFNLCPLIFYKYSPFLLGNVIPVAHKLGLFPDFSVPSLHLPLGISFFTFQAMSYLIDVYRKTCPAQKNPIDLGLYIALFPQLIAGPIVRYHDIAKQIRHRRVSVNSFGDGVERFILGLGKKVLLANPLGNMADIIFTLSHGDMTTASAWIGIICYSLQIYYDFSGYSDMAIGLGKMFGFTFLENFNYPYIARSIQDFWRRWHISLSNWFRDYLYIPLGGNRKGSKRTIINLFIVFLLCGFWHGASWNFIIWGLFHGSFLGLERTGFGHFLKKIPRITQHAYTLLIVMTGWVFFRAETMPKALDYLEILAGASPAETMHYSLIYHLDAYFWLTLGLAVTFMLPVYPLFRSYFGKLQTQLMQHAGSCIRVSGLWFILVLAISSLATGVYNPFIYFRF